MAFELNPLAVQNAPVLRYLALPDEDRGPTVADAARRLERDESNLRKTFKALENAGIIDVARQLTPDGRDQLAALDRAGDPNAAGALTALHSDLEPHPLNPRKDFETAEAEEALDELRISIVKSGLLQPIVVRPKAEAGKWWIIAGERRWRAIGQAISDGDWDDDQPIEVTAREVDDRDHLLLALNENLQRSNMSAIEEGVAFGAAVNDFGLSTEELATRTGKSQRYVQQRIALLKLDQVDQDRMRLPRDHPDRLSFKAARALTQTPRPVAADEPERIATLSATYTLPQPKHPHAVPLLRIELGQHEDGSWSFATGSHQPGVGGGGYGLSFVEARKRAIAYSREALISAVSELRKKEIEAGPVDHKRIAWLDDVLAGRISADAVADAADDDAATAAAAEPGSNEPGSPAEDAAKFGRSLTDREALAFVEIIDKAERHPATDAALAAEGYTEVADARDAARDNLIQKGLIAIRYRGGEKPHARAYLMKSGAKAWLEEIGFYDPNERPLLLREFRTRVCGIDAALNNDEFGTYATVWLNPPHPQTGDAGTGRVYRFDPTLTQAEIDGAFAATQRRIEEVGDALSEPEQPALIEETPDEKANRLRLQRIAAEAAADENALQTFVGWMREKMARKREQGFGGWQNPNECKVEDLAAQLVGHVAKGDPVDIAILAMMVGIRAGAIGAPGYLNRLPIPRMERLMIEARAQRPIPSEPVEPDPVEDFIEAELADDEDQNDLGQQGTGDYRPGPGEPAVLIRKSITPDFIVCLEDGRKFKSLKRHLRTRYNLSPEEYRAKWGLPADYPMVAPNYAKARADLARQMGLEPAA